MSGVLIDIPFEFRHICWFCGEPCNQLLDYPLAGANARTIAIPSCKECRQLANKQLLTSYAECRVAVKDALMKRYAKHLAIGLNWTEEELAEADFTCRTLQSFQQSAWFMFEVARDRINFNGWQVSVDGVSLDEAINDTRFEFDGVQYSSVFSAIEQYCRHLALDRDFLSGVVAVVGKHRFGHAVRLARIHIVSSDKVKRAVIQELIDDVQAFTS
ncbi:hypothetical protein HR45_14685 [Shewanella mangrovi]|uniref:Uncharacterized protein n=1 Tax=Shewanella mangrovi TaxID=1515746 RepID=A0A094LNJ6_9GAMM|nr:hypothetical protein [Shewanella mangrovi]KFZ36703.1 hypothetical protein HR45_14685 [Shewanella mangrovi]